MIKNVGLWIDHRNAVVVFITDQKEETMFIRSGMEKFTQFSSGSSKVGTAEDPQGSQYQNHLNGYYDEVIKSIRDADAILILGPGEAKEELEARLQLIKPDGYTLSVETAEKMTSRQIAARVQHHFFVNV
jgi:stalled ribosome rescue protein Dom34